MHLRCIYAGWDITPKVHNKDIPGQPLVNPFDFYTSKLSKFTTSNPAQKLYHPTLKAQQNSQAKLKMLKKHQKTLF